MNKKLLWIWTTGIALCASVTFGADIGRPVRRIDFSPERSYISHPHYINARFTRESPARNTTLTFKAVTDNPSWAYLAVRVQDMDQDENFSGVRIVFKATLPPGMLMCFVAEESDVAYEYQWELEKPGEWDTMIVLFSRMTPSPWNRKADSNEKLDIDQIRTMLLGATGTVAPETAETQGVIEIRDIYLMRR